MPDLTQSIGNIRISIREKIQLITQKIRELGKIEFSSLTEREIPTIEIVVTFLALLELMKQRWVEAEQHTLFGDIQINRTGFFEENETFDLEFGE
jgi:segregation and condensation protein A